MLLVVMNIKWNWKNLKVSLIIHCSDPPYQKVRTLGNTNNYYDLLLRTRSSVTYCKFFYICYFILQIFIIFINIIYYGKLLLRSPYKPSFLHQKVNICIKFDLLLNAVITWVMFVFLLKIFVAHYIQFIKTLSLSRNLPSVEIMHILSAFFL